MMRDDSTLQFRLPAATKTAFLAAVETEPETGDWWKKKTMPSDVLRRLVDDYIEKHKPKAKPEAKPAKKRAKP